MKLKRYLPYIEGFQDIPEKQEAQFWLSLISRRVRKQLSFYKITEYKQPYTKL